MGRVFVDISMSLDGYVTAPNDAVGRGLGDGGECLHNWIFGGPWTYGGDAHFVESGIDRDVIDEAFGRMGAVIMGRRVFDLAEGWGDEPPFRVPCFVLTHRGQEPQVRGATTFTFVTDGIDSALSQARAAAAAAGGAAAAAAGGAAAGGAAAGGAAAGGAAAVAGGAAAGAAGSKDISIMGGASAVQQYLRAGVVDEMQIHLAPVLLGAGTRLFDGGATGQRVALEQTRVIESRFATHLTFDVVRESDLPAGLSKPAQRALAGAGYRRLGQLGQVSEAELGKLHGMGPKAIRLLRDSLAAKGLSFRAS